MDKISVIIPCFNEQEAIPVYYDAILPVMDSMKEVTFELIFADICHFPEILGRKQRSMQACQMLQGIMWQ